MTEPTKTPDEINAKLLEPFPTDVIEDKQGKRYIGHEHIRMRVIEATGNQFDWQVTGREIRDQDGVIRARKSGTIPPVMIVDGILTIPGLGSRAGTGVQVLEENAGEDTYKAAESDAFKRAAMAFGIALRQLYMNEPAQRRPQPAQKRTTSTETNDTDPRGLMPMPQFMETFSLALFSKDARELKGLMDGAADSIPHWVAMADLAGDAKQLKWVKDEMEKRGISRVPAFDDAYKARTAALQAQKG